MISHTGTETRPRLLREAAVGNIGQWGQEEGWAVNTCLHWR